MGNPKRAMVVGRFQPFHDGHKWLIDSILERGEDVLVCVMCPDEKDDRNPYDADDIAMSIVNHYHTEADLSTGPRPKVLVTIIPTITSVDHGRDVGWDIREHIPPHDIRKISATEIREREQ